METKNNKVPFWDILKTLTIFLIAFIVVIFVAKSLDSLFIKSDIDEKPIERPLVSCEPTRLGYETLSQNTGQVVDLISERKTMSAKNG